MQVLLDKEAGIHNPTRVRVNEEGKRLVVINRDGFEIMNYDIKAESSKYVFLFETKNVVKYWTH